MPASLVGLALGVVEIGRDGYHRLRDLLAEIGFGRLLHLLQDEGGDLRGRVGLALRFDPGVAIASLDDLVRHEPLVLLDDGIVIATPDQALHREDRVCRIGHRLPARRLADEPLAIGREGDDRRRRARTLGVLDDARSLAVHDGNAGIRGAEIDSDDFGHRAAPCRCLIVVSGLVAPCRAAPDDL